MTDRNRPEPAEACTEIGAEHDAALPEGLAIATLFVAVVAVLAALLGVHLAASLVN